MVIITDDVIFAGHSEICTAQPLEHTNSFCFTYPDSFIGGINYIADLSFFYSYLEDFLFHMLI